MIAQPNTREKLLKFRQRAKQLASESEQKYLTDKEVLLLLARALPETNSLLLIDALKHDLLSFSPYDCVAMWCDIDKGLAKQFPLQILQVASTILPIEK